MEGRLGPDAEERRLGLPARARAGPARRPHLCADDLAGADDARALGRALGGADAVAYNADAVSGAFVRSYCGNSVGESDFLPYRGTPVGEPDLSALDPTDARAIGRADAPAYAWAIARSDANASALNHTVADSPRLLTKHNAIDATRARRRDVAVWYRSLRSGTARSDQHGGVLTARGLGAEFSGARSTH